MRIKDMTELYKTVHNPKLVEFAQSIHQKINSCSSYEDRCDRLRKYAPHLEIILDNLGTKERRILNSLELQYFRLYEQVISNLLNLSCYE